MVHAFPSEHEAPKAERVTMHVPSGSWHSPVAVAHTNVAAMHFDMPPVQVFD
jgi:hypothetical protein